MNVSVPNTKELPQGTVNKSMVLPATSPSWMTKIQREHNKTNERFKEARIALAIAKLEIVSMIDEINEDYDTEFQLEHLFGITEQEEGEALVKMEDEDDDE